MTALETRRRRYDHHLLGAGTGGMDARVTMRRGETDTHSRLKRLALLWAQANGYSACAMEVACRNADIAPTSPPIDRSRNDRITAIFECKQAPADLRRDNCSERARASASSHLPGAGRFSRNIFASTTRPCAPAIRYFPNTIRMISPRSDTAVTRAFCANCPRCKIGSTTAPSSKSLLRYRCANLFFLVLPNELFRDAEIPVGWGALVESDGSLALMRKPVWQETAAENRVRLSTQRIAIAGTRADSNRHALEITFERRELAGPIRSARVGS